MKAWLHMFSTNTENVYFVLRQNTEDCVMASTNEVIAALNQVATNMDDLPPIPCSKCVQTTTT